MGYLFVNEDIEAAAEWLDEHYPGWAATIDTENFDMTDADVCIGGYLGVDWYEDLHRPFMRDTGRLPFFAAWTEEWIVQIEKRV